ncbi:hypothetical protein NC652_024156 [Populus alba x Populus x berolinensis]|nr:hypothetical protein NC652_024156 [Populus alba x Populus x berolinensis]
MRTRSVETGTLSASTLETTSLPSHFPGATAPMSLNSFVTLTSLARRRSTTRLVSSLATLSHQHCALARSDKPGEVSTRSLVDLEQPMRLMEGSLKRIPLVLER